MSARNPRKRRRAPPPRVPLFDEIGLKAFVAETMSSQDDQKSPQDHIIPDQVVPVIYRIAMRVLKTLPDFETLSEAVAAWRELTRVDLLRRNDVPNSLVTKIMDHVPFLTTKLVSNVDSSDGETSKLLIETYDGHRIEAVPLRRHGRNLSVCVSSQVGCAMGCQFCATGTMGIIGDLTTAEILEQAILAKLAPSKLRSLPLKNIVFMGMGEPLNNWESVRAAVIGFTDFNRFGLGKGNITVSTVGVVPSMKKLNDELPGVAVALSLHAPNQVLRERIVPAARAWPLPKLMAALDAHIQTAKQHMIAQNKRKKAEAVSMMVEYVLLAGVNDRPEHAIELAELLHGKPVMVNLIPYNKNVTSDIYGFESPSLEESYAFGKILIDRGLRARVRIERGADIAAACGQLALTAAGTKAKDRHNSTSTSKVVDIEDIVGSREGKKAYNGMLRKNIRTAHQLKAEKMKLLRSHPASPTVSWDSIEQLCGSPEAEKSVDDAKSKDTSRVRFFEKNRWAVFAAVGVTAAMLGVVAVLRSDRQRSTSKSYESLSDAANART